MKRYRALLMGVMLGLLLSPASLWADGTQPAPSVAPVPLNPPAVSQGNGPAAMDTMTDILDIKPPQEIGFDPRIIRWTLAVIGCILVLLLMAFLIDRYLKKRKKKERSDEVTLIPVDIRVLQALDRMEAEGFDDARLFYFNLTATVKMYLDGRFGLDAPEMTTEELLPAINTLPVEKQQGISLKELLKRSDPVKFAGLSEERSKMIEDLGFIRSFVNQTREVASEESGDLNP
jgi:hypothetical protein